MNPFSILYDKICNHYIEPVEETKVNQENVSTEILQNESVDLNNASDKSLSPERAKKIERDENSWNAVINDLSHYVVVERASLDPVHIKNTSAIIKDILLSLGSMAGKDEVPLQFDDPNFGRHLIASILRFISKLNLGKYDPETKEGITALRKDLKGVFGQLIKDAGLDKEQIIKKPIILQQIFYPSNFTKVARLVGTALYEIPEIGIDKFENNFIDFAVEMCIVQKRHENQSKNPILNHHKDASKFAEFIVSSLMPLVKSGDISINLPLNKKNNNFVMAELNTIFSENDEIKKTIHECVAGVLKGLDSKVTGKERQDLLIKNILKRLVQVDVLGLDKSQLRDVLLEKLAAVNLLREFSFLAKEGNEKFLANLGISTQAIFDAAKLQEDKSDAQIEQEEIELNPVEFLTSVIFKGLPCNSPAERDRRVVDESLNMIENQLEMCVKAILAVILTPKEGESPEDRRTNLLNEILDRFISKFGVYTQELSNIDKLSKNKLQKRLIKVSEDITKDVYKSKTDKLLERYEDPLENPHFLNIFNPFSKKVENWDTDAAQLIKQAWIGGEESCKIAVDNDDKTGTHDNLIKLLEGWKDQEKNNENWKFEYSERAQALLAKKDVTWEMEARQILKLIEADKLAKFALENEFNPQKFSNLFPKLLPAEKVFPQLYKIFGEKILTFHEHAIDLSQKGKVAEDYIKKTNVKELPGFINAILNTSIETIEEMAEKNKIDLGFSFLNDAFSNLLKKTSVNEPENDSEISIKPSSKRYKASSNGIISAEITSKTKFKDQVKLMVKDVVMVVISDTIQRTEHQECLAKIDAMRLAWESTSADDPFFKTYITKSEIKDYRREMKIAPEVPESLEFYKECYLWVQENKILNANNITDDKGSKILQANDVFSNLIDKFLQDALSNFEVISQLCKENQKLTVEEKKAAILNEANILGIKLKKSNETLDVQYRNLLLRNLARTLTGDLVPQELFNSLLPKEFQDSGLWEKIADKMFAPYVTGIFEKTMAFRDPENQADSKFSLSAEDKERFGPLINDLVEFVEEKLPKLDLGGILEDLFKKSDANNIDFSVLDRLFGNAIKKNGEFIKLIGSSLPKIIESILAFHLNAKNDGLTSQERATELIWNVIKTMEAAFSEIDSLKASCEVVLPLEENFNFEKVLSKELIAAYRKEMNVQSDVPESIELFQACYVWEKNNILLSNIQKQITDKDMAAYRKEMKIDVLKFPDSPELYKQCYLWVQTNKILNQSTNILLDLILPESLWNVYVAEQFGALIPRSQVGKWLIDYMKEGYEHSTHMKNLVSEGKGTVKNEENKWSGLGSYIDEKMDVVLKDALKKDDLDSPHVQWFKDVLGSLMSKQTATDKPVSNMISSSVYAILGKILSGGLSSISTAKLFTKSGKFDKSSEANASLTGKIANMIPEIRDNCYKLNSLQPGQKCSSLNRLTPDTVLPYLSVVGGSLNKFEIIETFPDVFTLNSDGRIVAEITIFDKKKLEGRKISIDVHKFTYWDVAYNAIDTLITNDDWNELIPKIAKSLVTKELIASFVAPYVEGFHQIQGPLQKKAKDGEVLMANLNAESKDYQECMTKIKEMRSAWKSSNADDPFFRENITEVEINDYRRKSEIAPEVPESAELYKKCYLWVQSNKILHESKSDVNEYILDKIYAFLNDMSESDKKINDKLPGFLDKLIKGFLGNEADNSIKDAREVIIQRVVHLLLGEVLRPAEGNASATERSALNIRKKLNVILQTSQNSPSDYKAIARTFVDVFLPETTWNEIFQGKFKDLVTRKDIIDLAESFLALGDFSNPESKKTSIIDAVKNKYEDASTELLIFDLVIEEKEREANLKVSKGGGLVEMVKVICDSIDDTIDEYAGKDKVAELPSLFNAVGIEALKNPETSQAIKESSRALVTIALARMLKAKPDQSQEARVFEVLGNLINAYDSKNPDATAMKWIEEFFPDDLRREILPKALYDILTPKFFSELIIKEYVEQFEVVADSLVSAPIDDEGKNISRLQAFVKKMLVGYKDPNSSRDGLAGMGGFVKALEGMIMGALGDGGEGAPVGEVIESILNQGIAKVMDGPQVKKLLDKQFMTEALSAALPQLGNAPFAVDFPELTEEQLSDLSVESLKKLGIDIRQDVSESKADFRKRVIKRHFELESAKKLTGILFPNGDKDLPVPKVAQPSVLNKVNEAVANQVARVTNRDQRVLMAIDLLGVSNEDEAAFEVLEDHLKENKNLNGEARLAEDLFKKNLVSFAMKKIDENVCTNWIQPFKWLAVSLVKAITWCAMKIAINRQVWNFISNPANDDKLRGFIWSFLSFASTYNTTKRTREEEEELNNRLGIDCKDALGDIGLLHGLRWIIAPMIAKQVKDQNFVDIIA